MCKGIKIVWLGCEKQPNLAQKWPKNSHFSIFFRVSQKQSIRFERNFLQSFYTILWSFMCSFINSYGWDVRNIAKFSPKIGKNQSFFDFFDFLTNCLYDSNESESEGKRLKPTPLPHMRLWLLLVLEIILRASFLFQILDSCLFYQNVSNLRTQ